MLRRIILCSHSIGLIATMEAIMKHWGYRVLSVSDTERAKELLAEISPNLLFVERDMLDLDRQFAEKVKKLTASDKTTLIVMEEAGSESEEVTGYERLRLPFDIFELFALIQKHLEKIPRRHLRLSTSLPGLLFMGDTSHLVDILSLSSNGLFVKTSLKGTTGQELEMILPLYGLKQEIEIPCRVLYVVQPCVENNYLQGFGVEFISPEEEKLELLRQYLEQKLLGEMKVKRPNVDEVEIDQISTRSDQTHLMLVMGKKGD